MASDYLRYPDQPGVRIPKFRFPRGWFGFHVEGPKGPDGLVPGLLFRLSVTFGAAAFSFLLCIAWGVLNGWRITTPLLVAIAASFTLFVSVGELVRVRAFAGIVRSKQRYMDVGEVRGGLSIEGTVIGKDHLIYNERAWARPELHLRRTQSSWYHRFGKRSLDILVSLLLLIVFFPLIALLLPLVKIATGGPVLGVRTVYGAGGSEIVILNFRTVPLRKVPDGWDDGLARISRFGSLLHRTGLDRLLELINVLKGDLSLVGPEPRPLDLDRDRLPADLRPGLTGLALASGHQWDESQRAVLLDRYYLLYRSFRFDLLIMWRTLRLLLSG